MRKITIFITVAMMLTLVIGCAVYDGTGAKIYDERGLSIEASVSDTSLTDITAGDVSNHVFPTEYGAWLVVAVEEGPVVVGGCALNTLLGLPAGTDDWTPIGMSKIGMLSGEEVWGIFLPKELTIGDGWASGNGSFVFNFRVGEEWAWDGNVIRGGSGSPYTVGDSDNNGQVNFNNPPAFLP